MISVLIIDDHAIVRAGVRRVLNRRLDVECLDATTGEAAVELASGRAFDLAVADLNLPGLGGPALVQELLRTRPQLKVLVFSTHTEPIFVRRSLDAGALGYISKNVEPEELATAVEAVLKGQVYLEADLSQDCAESEVELRALTPRELEILRLMSGGRSLTEISVALGIAYKTVANISGQIKEKLGAAHTADLIRFSVARGLF